MRELADHQAAAVEAREQVVLARDALALRGVGELEQQVRAGEPIEGSDRHVERARLARRPGRAQRRARGRRCSRRSSSTRRRMPPSRLGLVQEIRERSAARLLQAEGEQVLRGDVGIHRAQLRVEHDDAGGERIEQVGRVEMRERRRCAVLNRHEPRAPARGDAQARVSADGSGRCGFSSEGWCDAEGSRSVSGTAPSPSLSRISRRQRVRAAVDRRECELRCRSACRC